MPLVVDLSRSGLDGLTGTRVGCVVSRVHSVNGRSGGGGIAIRRLGPASGASTCVAVEGDTAAAVLTRCGGQATLRRVDPVSLVVAAVALGASAGLKDTAAQAVKDAYEGLKRLLAGREVDVAGVERRPDSAAQRAALEESLTDAGGADDDLVAASRAVTAAVAAHSPDAGRVVGVSLTDLQAEFVNIGKVTSTGDGVVAERLRLSGGFTVAEVRAGEGGGNPSVR